MGLKKRKIPVIPEIFAYKNDYLPELVPEQPACP
jgi:hypothetical protein